MELTLAAEPRSDIGKGAAKKLRAAGKVPATLYGTGTSPISVSVDARAMGQALHTEAGRNVLIDLQVDGESYLTIPRELQRNPVRGTLLHVDFLRISRTQVIQVDVPIHIEGDSPGVKEGGVVEHHLWSVRVECLPGDVPESLIADISTLGIGASVHVRELRLAQGATILTDPDEIVLSVVVPQILKLEEEAPAEAVEGAEAAAAAEEGAAPEAGAAETPAE